MKCINGVWLPDEEQEVTKFLLAQQVDGVGVYQYGKWLAAKAHCKRFRTAVDIGGHCGLWSMQMAKVFDHVHAFEPVERHRECFVKNAPTVCLYPYALGNKEGNVRLVKGVKSTGDTCISDDGEYEAELKTLDSFDLQDVDFIKIDAEGYELFICQGAEETIKRCRPAMIVEQKPGKAKAYGLEDTEAVKWLIDRGYKLQGVIAGDYLLTPISRE